MVTSDEYKRCTNPLSTYERRTHMKSYINEDGVENIACAMIDQARKDFIKGGKVLYGVLKCIPTQKELLEDPTHISLSNNADVRWLYDAWRFVRDDPYRLFGDVGEETIIKAWTNEAIKEYYKVAYIKGGTVLYINHSKKPIHILPEEEIIEVMKDNQLAADFLKARKYISDLKDKDNIFHEWNVIALSRSRKKYYKHLAGIDPEYRPHSEKLKETKQKNIKTAKELYESGMSERAIARYLGVQTRTVMLYLKS